MSELVPLKILYVEDEPDLRERIRIVLEMHFAGVIVAAGGREALALFGSEAPDVVVTDIMMPVMDGIELARRIRTVSPDTPVIFTTAFTETGYLLQAIELAVCAYVRKPIDCRHLVDVILRVAKPILQQRELAQAKARELSSLELLLGESEGMQEVIRQAQAISATDFSVIVQGETGVGKSHLASLIHGLGRRKHSPFITVTLGSLPDTLAESQLFGHVKGAFTGALSSKTGLFEEANGGTLFLDDIDCASGVVQAKILHAVETKSFFPVGATKPVRADVRIIAASNRDLVAEMRKGTFREDLYYRLGDLVITVPPLRARGDDIVTMARLFLNEISLELDRVPPRLSPDAILFLRRHLWPGNVRELKSVMKRAALFAGETLTAENVAGVMTGRGQAGGETCRTRLATMDEVKRNAIKETLAATGGKKMEAARLLDLDYSSFKRMLNRYGL